MSRPLRIAWIASALGPFGATGLFVAKAYRSNPDHAGLLLLAWFGAWLPVGCAMLGPAWVLLRRWPTMPAAGKRRLFWAGAAVLPVFGLGFGLAEHWRDWDDAALFVLLFVPTLISLFMVARKNGS